MTKSKKTIAAAGIALLVLSMPFAVSAATNGVGNSFGNGTGYGKGPMAQSGINDIAGIVGKTTDELMQERRSGKTMLQIVEASGQTKEQVIASFIEKRKAVLADRVEQGLLTQEQADTYLSQMEERISANWDRVETGRPSTAPGNRQGMGKGRGAMGHLGKGPGFGGFGNGSSGAVNP